MRTESELGALASFKVGFVLGGVFWRNGLRLGMVLAMDSILHGRGADKRESMRKGWPVEEAQIRNQSALGAQVGRL